MTMRFDLGAVVRHPGHNAIFMIVDHVRLPNEPTGLGYSYVDPKLPYLPWVTPLLQFEMEHELVERPYYEVGRLNPSTWSVHHPAPGNSALKHVFAQVDSLIAAQRLAVTQNLLRAAHRSW